MAPWRRMGLVLALASASAAPVHAGLFDDEEARARIEQLRGTVAEVQEKLGEVSRNQLEFANQQEALRAEIARINGQLEVLKYELDNAQKRQQDFYVDLDARLRKLEGTGTEATPAAGAEGAPAEAPDSPDAPKVSDADAYEQAITALKAGKSKEAEAALDAFIASYPQSKLLGSAHYWNAYARSQLKDHRGAASLYGRFAEGWPDDPRAPDALENQAESLLAAKDAKGARAVWQRLADKYPASEPGKRARQQLKKG